VLPTERVDMLCADLKPDAIIWLVFSQQVQNVFTARYGLNLYV
jgi:hypothetical protein